MAETELGLLDKDFERLQKQKRNRSGGVEPRTLVNLFHCEGEHHVYYADNQIWIPSLDTNRVNACFNLVENRKNKIVGRLSAINPVFKARGDTREYKVIAMAQTVDNLTRALDQKLDQAMKTWELLDWMAISGVGYEFTPWLPDETDEALPVRVTDLNEEDLARLQPGLFPPQDMELVFEYDAEQGQGPVLYTQSTVDALEAQGTPREAFILLEYRQRTGDVGSIIFGALSVFIDHSVKSIASLPPGMWVHIAQVKTKEWIERNFENPLDGIDYDDMKPNDIRIVTTKFNQSSVSTMTGTNMANIMPAIQGSLSPDDPDMFVYIESYDADGRQVHWIPKIGRLRDGDTIYDDGIPLVDFHWKTTKTTHYNQGFVENCIPANQYFTKRMQQLAEYGNRFVKAPRLLGPNLAPGDVPTDEEGYVEGGLSADGTPMVRHMDPPMVGDWFMQTIKTAMDVFDDLSGGADLFKQSQFPGQMRGSMGLPLLQEILDTEWGTLYSHFAQRMALVKEKRLERVRQFYPPVRTLHYVDRNQEEETMIFHSNDTLRAGIKFKITVQPGSIVPELRAFREERISNRLMGPLSGLYMDRRTGTIDYSKVAADLEFGDTGREERESQARKLALKIIEDLHTAKQVPPVMPWFDLGPMLDEFEAAMSTEEFLYKASQQIQEAFFAYWQQLSTALQEQAAAAQSAEMDAAVDSAVNQAAQQAAAKAASAAVEAAMEQLRLIGVDPQSGVNKLVQQEAVAQAQGSPLT